MLNRYFFRILKIWEKVVIYFVSRHEGAIAWIRSRKEWHVDCFVPHLDVSVLQAGDVVLGTLPVHLAAEVCGLGAEFYFLEMPQTEARCGTEYSAEEMSAAGCRLRRFDVRAL